MSLLANYSLRVTEESATRITRRLPGQSQVQVAVGQEVKSSDIIALSAVPLGYHSFNLAKALGAPKALAGNYLQKKAGEKIFAGELLARRGGLLGKKDVLSPTDALVEDYSKETGMLKLQYSPKNVTVSAGVYGIVEHIDGGSGEVIIKTMAKTVFGMVGVGRDRGGPLEVIGEAGALCDERKISPASAQKILVVGGLVLGQAYEKAALVRAAGVISGGINVRDYKAMAGDYDVTREAMLDPEITVMATEGFGSWPIGEDIYQTLKLYQGRFVFLDGKNRRLLLPSNQPDSIITLRRVALPPNHQVQRDTGIKDLVTGLQVRIIWPPFAGYVGKIITIDATPTTLGSGLVTHLVGVETKNRKIKVPLNNLEIIQ